MKKYLLFYTNTHELDGSDRRQIEAVAETHEFYGNFFTACLPLAADDSPFRSIDDKTHVGGVIKIVNNSRLIEQNILFEPWGKLPRKIKKYV